MYVTSDEGMRNDLSEPNVTRGVGATVGGNELGATVGVVVDVGASVLGVPATGASVAITIGGVGSAVCGATVDGAIDIDGADVGAAVCAQIVHLLL